MNTNNNNNTNNASNPDEQLVTKILGSSLIKTIVTLLIFVGTTTWSIQSMKTQLEESIVNLRHGIEIQNVTLDSRLKNIEDRQDRDFRYITENYVKRTDYITIPLEKNTKNR